MVEVAAAVAAAAEEAEDGAVDLEEGEGEAEVVVSDDHIQGWKANNKTWSAHGEQRLAVAPLHRHINQRVGKVKSLIGSCEVLPAENKTREREKLTLERKRNKTTEYI